MVGCICGRFCTGWEAENSSWTTFGHWVAPRAFRHVNQTGKTAATKKSTSCWFLTTTRCPRCWWNWRGRSRGSCPVAGMISSSSQTWRRTRRYMVSWLKPCLLLFWQKKVSKPHWGMLITPCYYACLAGITHVTGRCLSDSYWGTPCRDRDQYVYFDDTHTTQAADFIFALNCFNGTLCSPKNVFKLVGMWSFHFGVVPEIANATTFKFKLACI